jgi:hypothetical protein
VAHVVKTRGAVRVYVTTTASGDYWQASVTSAHGRALPNVRFGYKDLGNGTWKMSIYTNKHVVPGLKKIVRSADEGTQYVDQIAPGRGAPLAALQAARAGSER